MKICKDCHVEKDETDFYLYKESGIPRARCKACASLMAKSNNTKHFKEKRRLILEKKKRLNALLMKECDSCHEAKAYESFYRRNSGALFNRCKNCLSLDRNKPENLEKKKKYQDKYVELNKQKILRRAKHYSKEYRIKFPNKVKASNKVWRSKNKHKIKELMRNFRERNKSRPLYRMKLIFSQRIRKVQKKNKWRKMNISPAMLGCSFEEFREHIQSQFSDGMHWNNYGVMGWHLDHKFPVSACKTEDDLIRCYHYSNLQPLWWRDNLKKSNKIPEGVALP